MSYKNIRNYTKTGYGKRASSNTTVVTADWKTVPWEQCAKVYEDAATLAVETAQAERQDAYRRYVAECALKNEDPKPYTDIPNKRKVRLVAGNKAILTDFIPKYKINDFGIHYMPQIVAHIASTMWVITMGGEDMHPADYYQERVLGAEGCISLGSEEWEESQDGLSALQFLEKYFKDPRMMGVYRFLMLDSRSSFIPTQYKGDARSYCTLVPTIMFAFKLYHNIPYSAWDKKECEFIMPAALYEAATSEVDYNTFEKDELIKAREDGLLWKTGEKAGKARNPLYTHRLFGIQETTIGKLPELAQVMLTQIWCAHPDNRTKYMILSPNYWDSIPPPLIGEALKFDHHSINYSLPNNSSSTMADVPWA